MSESHLQTEPNVQAALDRGRSQPGRAVALVHGVDTPDVKEVLKLCQRGRSQSARRHRLREPEVRNLVILLIDLVRREEVDVDRTRGGLAPRDRLSRVRGIDYVIGRKVGRYQVKA